MSPDRELVNDGIPLRTKMWDGAHAYDGIDKGIRFMVRVLHSHGIETCQSCEGGDGHAYDHPTVDLIAGPDDMAGFAAVTALTQHGIVPASVSQTWDLDRLGRPYETIWRVVFREARPDLADDELMFIWGYQAQESASEKAARKVLSSQEPQT